MLLMINIMLLLNVEWISRKWQAIFVSFKTYFDQRVRNRKSHDGSSSIYLLCQEH